MLRRLLSTPSHRQQKGSRVTCTASSPLCLPQSSIGSHQSDGLFMSSTTPPATIGIPFRAPISLTISPTPDPLPSVEEEYHHRFGSCNWSRISHEEYSGHMQQLHERGFDASMLPGKEVDAFLARRYLFVCEAAKKLSAMVGNSDLVEVLRDQRKALRHGLQEQRHMSHKQGDQGSYIAKALVKHKLGHFSWDESASNLKLPKWSYVAVDTSLVAYLAQKGVPKFARKCEAVEEMFKLPFHFSIAESVFIEFQHALFAERFEVAGMKYRRLSIKWRWLAAFVQRVLDASHIHYKLGSLSKQEAKHNEALKWALYKETTSSLEGLGFSQSERGRGSYKNVSEVVEKYKIQTYDARIIVEGVGPKLSLILTEDGQHAQALSCRKEGKLYPILTWHYFKHKVVCK